MKNSSVKCVVIEDEDMATKLLVDYIEKYPELELVATFDSPVDFIVEKENLKFDLLFLDIYMPEMTGIDLIRSIPIDCEVIITSASPDFALDCYSLKVVDYLLKPYRIGRFMEAVEKATKLIRLKKFSEFKQVAPERTHMMVKVDKRLVKVKIADILYVEAAWEYAKIHTQDQCLMTLVQIKRLEQDLDNSSFFRIHRSYLINLDHVDYIEGNQVCINGNKLPVSRNYKQELMQKMNERYT